MVATETYVTHNAILFKFNLCCITQKSKTLQIGHLMGVMVGISLNEILKELGVYTLCTCGFISIVSYLWEFVFLVGKVGKPFLKLEEFLFYVDSFLKCW